MAEIESTLGESRNSNNEPPIEDSKKRKTVKPRSIVWEHFERYVDCDGNKRARCLYCSSNYAADSNANGTSSLNNHLRKCTQNPHNAGTKQAKLRFQENSKDSEITLRVSGSSYVTSNVHFHEIGEVACILKMLVDSDDTDLSCMAEKMKAKFEKYWGAPEKMNKMIFVACVLDPRFKFEYVAFVLLNMYGEEKGGKMRDDLKLYVISLYDEYQIRTSKESQSESSASASKTIDNDMSSSGSAHKKTLIQQEYLRHRAMCGIMGAKSELDKYLCEEVEPGNENFDILLWWKVNKSRFPFLAEMARDVLAIPISTVASESAFSTGGRVLDPFRSSLTPKLVQALVCAQDWIRNESLHITVEEDLDKLEKFEDDLANLGRGVPCMTDI